MTTEIAHTTPARTADFISQATAVEQSRAAAEVQAAVVVAQNVPRRMDEAVRQMREACEQKALADRAFYRYNRAGQQVSGPTIHLARELARCFGNFEYGIAELRRGDGDSEIKSWAWDQQNNTRNSRTVIVPHARDTKQGRKQLTELRDIQESNTNQGSRILRETIFALLPKWFTEAAIEACNHTLERGDSNKPLTERVADTIQSFADTHNVTKEQLEDKLARKSGQWTPQDLATLRVVWTSIQRGEVTKEDEFPQQRVTAAEITAQATPAPPAAPPAAHADGDWPEVTQPGTGAPRGQ